MICFIPIGTVIDTFCVPLIMSHHSFRHRCFSDAFFLSGDPVCSLVGMETD